MPQLRSNDTNTISCRNSPNRRSINHDMNGNGRTRVNGVDGHHRPQNWSVTWDESTTGNNIPGALLAKVIIASLEVGKLAWRFSAILITFQCCKSPLNVGGVYTRGMFTGQDHLLTLFLIYSAGSYNIFRCHIYVNKTIFTADLQKVGMQSG